MSALDLNAGLLFILVTLAAARTFRLLAYDTITLGLRKWYGRVLGKLPPRKAAAMWEAWFCPACLGFWLALGWAITALAWSDTLIWQVLAVALSTNYLGMLANGLLDVEHEIAEGHDD